MRLPVRLAGRIGLLAVSAAVAAVGTVLAQQPELQGGGLAPAPPQITRVDTTPATGTTEGAPQPFGYESEVVCFGYIGADGEAFIAQVVGAENSAEQTDYTENNLLYLDAGADRGLRPGDEFWIVTPQDEVIHPMTGKSMGRFYQYRGRAVLDCLEGRTATVRVTVACTDIPMGSFLKPYEPVPDPPRPQGTGLQALRSSEREGERPDRLHARRRRRARQRQRRVHRPGHCAGHPAGRPALDLPLRDGLRLRHPPAGLLLGLHAASPRAWRSRGPIWATWRSSTSATVGPWAASSTRAA